MDRWIDGFHRAGGMRLLGWEEALCIVYSCSEEDFWSLRISSAVTHKSVTSSRVVEWVRTSFAQTEWAKVMGAADAWRVGRRGAALHKPLTPQQRAELTEWVTKKSKDWALSPSEIRDMLKIAQNVNPSLIKEVRDENTPGTLTQSMLQEVSKLSSHLLQEQVANKIRQEKLTLKAVADLVDKLTKAKSKTEIERILNKTYERRQVDKPKVRNPQAEIKRLRNLLVTDALQQLSVLLPELERPQSFDDHLYNTLATITLYLADDDVQALEILQRENQSLKQQVKTLSEKIERNETTMTGMRRQIGSLREENDKLIRRG